MFVAHQPYSMKERFYPNQIIPLALTVVVCAIGIGLVWLEIVLLNRFVVNREVIIPQLRWGDILIGFTIYIKTAIDFAIFIGRLMTKFPGWKNRIMIEIGTALGNILGTMSILLLWDLFREVRVLMAIMIVIAGLVLLRMAEEGVHHVEEDGQVLTEKHRQTLHKIVSPLAALNRFFAPVLNRLIPSTNIGKIEQTGYWKLLILSFTVPFILGLDDFAGYIPLFNVVNVMGFATGVFLGHMLLNIALFLSPTITTRLVKNPVIAILGSIAFIGIAIWGFVEAFHLVW
ncbi:hypothetical protein KA517_02605 [Candidatus Gracilibacteria bacterium]|nr:hypothetical protein [Candidatus Gracilibacteria bacterium]